MSLAALDPGASMALDACSITDTAGRFGENGALGLGIVSGFGRVDHASDAGLVIPLTGEEPELRSSAQAWVVAASGRVWLPFWPADLADPSCVVVDGTATWYETGGHYEGNVIVPPDVAPDGRHTMRLPALAP